MTSCSTGFAASRRCSAPTWPARSAPTTLRRRNRRAATASPSPRSTWASRPTRRATSPGAASAATCCRRRRPSTRSPTSSPTGCSCPTGPATRPPPTTSSASPARCSAPGIPLFGICFGNQILGRALGRSTYKMVFGHRGINVPVIDHATGRVAITAQNHGFALEGEAGERFDTPFGAAEVSHTCANDGVVEGIRLVDGRAFSVQYHPEAAAGPHERIPVRPVRRLMPEPTPSVSTPACRLRTCACAGTTTYDRAKPRDAVASPSCDVRNSLERCGRDTHVPEDALIRTTSW